VFGVASNRSEVKPSAPRKRRRRITILLAVLLFGAVTVYFVRPHEPRFEGRSLSQWITAADNTYFVFRRQNLTNAEYLAALHAVKSIGTNAVPTLLGWARAKDSGLKHNVLCWLHENTTVCDGFLDDVDKHSLAKLGFQLLGEDASVAAPALLQLTREGDARVCINALFCLYFIEPDKESFLPVVTELTHNANPSIQAPAAMMLAICFPEELHRPGVSETDPRMRGARRVTLRQSESDR